MNSRLARSRLAAVRPNGLDVASPEVDEAREALQGQPEWGEVVRHAAFDAVSYGRFTSLPLSPEIEAECGRLSAALSARRAASCLSPRHPAVLAVTFGILILVGVMVWQFLASKDRFSGSDEVLKIVVAGDAARPDQFEEVVTKVSSLGDWFAMKGFDGFQVPEAIGKLESVGVRLFGVEGTSVAAVAIPKDALFLFAFNPTHLGVSVEPQGTWKILETERGAIAAKEQNGMCYVLSSRGKGAKLKQILDRIESGPTAAPAK